MPHASKLNSLPRWVALGLVGFLGACSYAWCHTDHPLWTDAARFGVVPVLQASGALSWAKARTKQLVQPLRACPLRFIAA